MSETELRKVLATYDRDIVAVCKSMVDDGELTRGEIYEVLRERARERQRPDETEQQSFSKCYTGSRPRDPDGAQLFQLHGSMLGRDHLIKDDPGFRRDVDIRKDGGTEAELNRKAAELMSAVSKDAKAKPLSFAQAFTKVYTDPANRDLVSRYKDEQQARLARIAAGA